MNILNIYKYKVSHKVFILNNYCKIILDLLIYILYIVLIETRKRRHYMTSLLGHEYKNQALRHLFKVAGKRTFKNAPSPIRERMSAVLWKYHRLALAN